MNENISRTDAHKIFANLYRKKREPEHQAKVDDALTKSNDVFIRIDLIQKIDAEYDKASKKEAQAEEAKEEKKPTGNTTIKIQSLGKDTNQSATSNKIITPDEIRAEKVEKVQEKQDKTTVGILDILLGSAANISKFAKESRSLDLGLFGRKPTISKNVEKLFRSLKEDEIISTIQALKYSEQVGWRIWKPAHYNIVLNYNRFFNAFISLDSLFMDEISAEVFLGRSMKMQMYYVRMLLRADTKDIIMEKVPALIKMEAKLYSKIEPILRGLNYGLSLENQKPSLTDAIVAFHIVMNKKMITWPEIERNLGVAPIEEHKFNATPEIMKAIELANTKLANDIEAKLNIQEELDSVRKLYFTINENGKLNFDFLNGIIDDYVSHYYPENAQTPTLKTSFKTTPPKLLQLVCRDLQTIYFPIIEGYVKVDKNQIVDILVFQTGLLFPEIDKINSIIRTLDTFNRKFPSFQYSFQKFSEDLTKGTTDQIEIQLVKVLSESGDFFGKFAKKMSIVIESHMLAVEYEKMEKANDKVLATKEKVIEEIKPMQRFVPHAEARYISQNRINGKNIFEILYEMTRYLYNYAVIFKDANTVNKLSMHKKVEAELDRLYQDYERINGKKFIRKESDDS